MPEATAFWITAPGRGVLRHEALRPLGSWFARQQRHWTDAFDRLEAVVASETPKRRKS